MVIIQLSLKMLPLPNISRFQRRFPYQHDQFVWLFRCGVKAEQLTGATSANNCVTHCFISKNALLVEKRKVRKELRMTSTRCDFGHSQPICDSGPQWPICDFEPNQRICDFSPQWPICDFGHQWPICIPDPSGPLVILDTRGPFMILDNSVRFMVFDPSGRCGFRTQVADFRLSILVADL